MTLRRLLLKTRLLRLTAIVATLQGCAMLGDAPPATAPRPPTAESSLLEVWVPGSVLTDSDPPNKRLNPLLNPLTPAPPLDEPKHVQRHCTAASLDTYRVIQDVLAAVAPAFDKLTTKTLDLAAQRNQLMFDKQRTMAQLGVVSGRRSPQAEARGGAERTGSRQSAGAAIQVRPNGGIRIDTQKILGDIFKPSTPPRKSGATRLFTPEEMNAALPDFGKLRRQVEFNRDVLKARDVRLTSGQEELTLELVQLYELATDRFAATPTAQSMNALNEFDRFRLNNVHGCMTRTLLTPQSLDLSNAVTLRYAELARKVLSDSAFAFVRDVRSASNLGELEGIEDRYFGTPFLRKLASEIPTLEKAGSETHARLLAQARAEEEARKQRDLAQAKVEAENRRQAFLRKRASNAAPSPTEFLALASTFLMESTAERTPIWRVEKALPDGIDIFSVFSFLSGIKLSTHRIILDSYQCKASGNRQECSFKHMMQHTNHNLGIIDTTRNDYAGWTSSSAICEWSDLGLVCEGLRKAVGYVEMVSVNAGGGSSPSSSGSGGPSPAEFDRDFRDFQDSQRHHAANVGGYYMGESASVLRSRGYGN